MEIVLENQESPSPLVESLWCSHSSVGGVFASIAVTRSELVFTQHQGRTSVMLRGPESRASLAHAPDNATFFGITLQLGVFVPALPPALLLDQHAALTVTGRSFWLNNQALPMPNPEDADVFIERLVRLGLLRAEPSVEAVLNHESTEDSSTARTLQRRFLNATGLSHRAVATIERARQAVALLQGGLEIPDVVHHLGYADQPHLTKTLSRLVGRTPARIAAEAWLHSPLRAQELEQAARLRPEFLPK